MVRARKKKGGRPGAADGDAGERVYSLANFLRDHGVPRRLGWLCLPAFMLLGVPKGGTTALYEMVAAHPDVLRTRKEPHWWTRGRDGETALHYLMQNYYAASQAVVQAAHAASAQTNAAAPPLLLPSSSSLISPPSGSGSGSRQLIFGDASASTFWTLYRASNVSQCDDKSNNPSVPTLMR